MAQRKDGRSSRSKKEPSLSLSRSTMCDWMGAAADLVSPLVGLMKDSVLESKKIHTDDTSVPVLDRGLGQTRRGRLWVYLGHAPHDHIVFDYTPSRERDGPADFLKDYSGYLQAEKSPLETQKVP